MGKEKIRMDKYLWAVRLFKTRTQAANECRNGRVKIQDVEVKPSRLVQAGDVFSLRKNPVTLTFRIKEALQSRVSAKRVDQYLEDLTPEKEKNKVLATKGAGFGYRERGSGRPTKKERRSMDRYRRGEDDHADF